MTTTSEASELVEALIEDYQRPMARLDPGNGEYRLRSLLAMARWAEEQQPVKVGDTVTLHPAKIDTIRQGSGWYGHREHLRMSAFEVLAVGFNSAYAYWYAEIRCGDGPMFAVPMSWIDSVSRDNVLFARPGMARRSDATMALDAADWRFAEEWWGPGVLKPPRAIQYQETREWRERQVEAGARVMTDEEWDQIYPRKNTPTEGPHT